ncbi:hypothetical protein Tco_1008566 [Tanacetum coccineum]
MQFYLGVLVRLENKNPNTAMERIRRIYVWEDRLDKTVNNSELSPGLNTRKVCEGDDKQYGYSSVGRFDVFFRNQLLVFQQHQDESFYDLWTRFKYIIRKVPNHGLSIWTLNEIFLKHIDSLSWHIVNLTSEGDLRKFSDVGTWYAIEDYTQYDKKCSNPTSAISDETIANPNAQIVRDDMVRGYLGAWHG